VTEVAATGFALSTTSATSSFGTDSSSSSYSLGLRYLVSSKLNFSYGLSISSGRSSSDAYKGVASSSWSHNFNTAYTVHPRYLTTSLFVTSSSNAQGGVEQGTSLRYQLSLNTRPLDTMKGGLSYAYSTSTSLGQNLFDQSVLGVSFTTMLYQGIDLRLYVTHVERESFAVGGATDTTDSISSTLSLVPWKFLRTSINWRYSQAEREQSGIKSSSDSTGSSASFSLRLTNKLLLSGNYSIVPSGSSNYSMSWLALRSMSVSLNYAITETSNSFGSSLSWSPMKKVRLNVAYSTFVSDAGTGTEGTTLTLNGSIRF
ncbi:MAG: hypothetical protein KAR06_08845, partial [Deltaproteobacteria bacterium]|nr:hypothetical protein [Deltaproteobacteria bacterium]